MASADRYVGRQFDMMDKIQASRLQLEDAASPEDSIRRMQQQRNSPYKMQNQLQQDLRKHFGAKGGMQLPPQDSRQLVEGMQRQRFGDWLPAGPGVPTQVEPAPAPPAPQQEKSVLRRNGW